MTVSNGSDTPPQSSHEDKILLVVTLIIGAVVGLVVVAFILLTENLGSRLYPARSAAWRRVLMPVIGAVSTGFLLYRYFPNARGSGIPQTKTALLLREGFISMRTVLGKFGLCSVSLASGIALGREGPSVQVGAGIASVLGRRLGLTAGSIKALVPAGASAALAAAFNTPISAVLFALEEVMGDMHAPILGSIVLSSATSWMVLHLVLGDEPLFHVPAYQLVHPLEFVFYAVLGLVGGLVSVAFVKLLLWQRKHFLAMPESVQWFLPGVGGLTVGLLGWFFPQVLGVGYGVVGRALNGQLVLGMMALLVFLKLIATATCYASGNAGGIFGPSLFIGAMMGGAVGGVAHFLAPDYTGSVGAYALVGMGAAFAGIVRVPMTSVIMIFEITRDYSIIVPLMIANLISYFLASKLQEEPIYEALQHQDGVHLPSGGRAREETLVVRQAFRTDSPVLDAAQTIRQTTDSLGRQRGAWPVADVNGLRGMVTAGQIDQAFAAGREEESVGILVPEPGPNETLTADEFPHVHPDHSLEFAMGRIADTGLPVLPVVRRDRIRELQGTISVPDIVAAFGAVHAAAPAAESGTQPRISMRLLGGVLAALAGLAILGGSLNYFYRTQRIGQAQAFRKAGNRLLAQARFDEAVAQYRSALSISHSVDDQLTLALALMKADAASEASLYLNEVLQSRPQSGPANLALARIESQQGQVVDAISRFQRAADGSWMERPEENRAEARMELVETLARAGRSAQAKAELLSLTAQLPNDPVIQERVGQMLTDFGLLRESADFFQDIAQRHPQDAAAYQGRGEAQFRMGDYAAALETFRRVLVLHPSNQTAAQRIEACESILALDPTIRGLSVVERYKRSEKILSSTLGELAKCTAGQANKSALSPDMEAARTTLARKRRPPSYSDATESNLALALRLWSARQASCGLKPAAEAPFYLVMAKLANR